MWPRLTAGATCFGIGAALARFGPALVLSALAQLRAPGLVLSALVQLRAPGLVLSALVQLHAPAWAKPLGPAWASAVLGVAGRSDVLALAPFAFQYAHQDSVKVASHVVNHFAAAAFSDKTYRFI